MKQMRRRDGLIGLIAAVVGAEATAQQPGKLPLVVFFSPGRPGDFRVTGFELGLRDLGLVDGQNIRIEYVYTTGDRLAADAAAIVARGPDVVVATTSAPTQAMMKATSTIPIVAAAIADPVSLGMAASLARPGGNVTGLSLMNLELVAKWVELLMEAVPRLERIGVMSNPDSPAAMLQVQHAVAAAGSLGIDYRVVALSTTAQGDWAIDAQFASMRTDGCVGVVVLSDSGLYDWNVAIGRSALIHGLPVVLGNAERMTDGVLIAYGANRSDLYRRSAHLMEQILRGNKVGELPFEQPTKFDLTVNLKTAQALGLTIPHSIMLRVDEVIE